MKAQILRSLALMALLVVNADTGTKAADDECKKCKDPGTVNRKCEPAGAGESGFTGCTEHVDVEHGYHCDFSGSPCSIPQ